MLAGHRALVGFFWLSVLLLTLPIGRSAPASSWKGVVRDAAGKPVSEAIVTLRANGAASEFVAKTSANGEFVMIGIAAGSYSATVRLADKQWAAANAVIFPEGAALTASLNLSPQGQILRVTMPAEGAASQGSGGEHLSSEEVSSLPLQNSAAPRLPTSTWMRSRKCSRAAA